MKFFRSYTFYLLLSALVGSSFMVTVGSLAHIQTKPGPASREEAYRANNIGVALLEQFKHKEGAEAFRNALKIDPKLNLARINLSIALFNVPDLAAAQREAQNAAALSPDVPQPYYILGLIAKLQSKPEEALAAFQRVLKIDPNDVGANINVGQLYSQQRKYPEAIAAFRLALTAEPYNATALYNLGQALMRAGQREQGQEATERFKQLRERGSATTIGQNYLEQGRYAEAIASTGAEPDLVDRTIPTVTFTDTSAVPLSATAASTLPAGTNSSVFGRRFITSNWNEASRPEIAAALAGSVTLFDMDGDGHLDLLWLTSNAQHLLRGVSGKFADVTQQSGALAAKFTGTPIGAVAGDFDNDDKPDLFVIRDGSLSLYHNDGAGKFSDVTGAAAIPAYPFLPSSVAFVDTDHDGDLDIFITGLADLSQAPKGGASPASAIFPVDFAGAPSLLLRNDGNGKFTDVTAAAKLNSVGHAVAVIPTDFNNRRDMDLLVVNYGKPLALYSNQRDGTFRDVAKDVGLDIEGRWSSAVGGDLNKDGFTDFFLGRADGPGLFATSDGKEKFKTAALAGSEASQVTQFVDYDNDGLLDALMVTAQGLRVWRNVGTGWMDTSARSVAGELAASSVFSGRSIAAADLDSDGDTDILLPSASGTVRLARNDGGNSNHSLRIKLSAKVSNRSSIGTKIETRAGSLVQKLETSSVSPAVAPTDVIFGLGRRATADAVRVLWPAGIVQAETAVAAANNNTPKLATLDVTELDRKPSSCPYLYAWNGERFEFITDFMGGGEMGHLEQPGIYNKPDPNEYVRIRGDQLKERNGRYELRVTNELEEAVFSDKFQLLAVDHPEGVEVYPNEGLTDPPRPFKLYATRGAQPPLTAVDDHGNDVLSRIKHVDRQYPDDFRRDRIRGYAVEHTLTMKLAERRPANARMVLLLTGWTDYAWSSDVLAASQGGKAMMLPALQVKDDRGRWQTVIQDIGIPVGRPQTVTVDLTGKFLSSSREVRIVTNMRILWDQILVDQSVDQTPLATVRLDPISANLRWRGFSAEVTPDGREPFGYDYEQISFTSPWKVMPGRYTREGDVRELLLKSDDMFVILRPGDEIGLSFDAGKLPPLRAGGTRTFLLYADGFSKEMDINSASPDQVLPLPFHRMTKYPYSDSESYPMTRARRAYMEKYNTRLVTAEVPSIDTVLTSTSAGASLGGRIRW
ncbi:MAG TPA: FG-GAP-like repeat-containing protein [Pyrinomonadaceae bacterium]|nr:FG-GAP-like repeat-containing protein [Pyrinomonadaceae bacterium]